MTDHESKAESEWLIAKADWGPGPWQDEPDRVEWRAHGLPALIVRNCRVTGALCGYAGVPPGHPLHGVKHYDDRCMEIEVHGGLTYSAGCSDDGDICHEPLPGEAEDVWWFGFDTAHAGDLAPRMVAVSREVHTMMGKSEPCLLEWALGDEYRDVDYVRAEVEQLAAQLSELGK